MKIMFSAGEVSGDLHGEKLAAALKSLDPNIELIGFGGDAMAESGVRLLKHLAAYSVMGVWAVIKNIRKIYSLLNELTRALETEKPDLLVIIDYPDFNWRLAARAKERGIKVFSYSPPSAWAWRQGRAKKCAAIADELVALYPFETPVYEKSGANIHFLGNPLVDAARPSMAADDARAFFGLGENERPVLLLPGSRRHEIDLLLPAMLGAAKKLKADFPATRFFLPVAQNISEEKMRGMAEAAGVAADLTFTREKIYDLMNIAEFAIASSGTVVMEAALLNLPCVVLYRFSPLSAFIGRLVVHIEHFSLPNILLGEGFQAELLQDGVNPERIYSEAKSLYRGEARGEEIRAKLKIAAAMLGEPDAATRIAKHIVACAKSDKRND